MIIQQLTGGLGNQMFQYAAAKALALRLQTGFYLDITHFLTTPTGKKNPRAYELFHFNVEERFKKPRWHWIKKFTKSTVVYPGYERFAEQHVQVDPDFFNISGNTYLEGCWQSAQYFMDYEKEIRKDFTFRTSPEGMNLDLAYKIKQVNAISLHVRRGDYVSNAHFNQMHGTTSLNYYKNAIAYLAQNVSDPYFFLFSDEPEWIKENLPLDFPFEIISHNQGEKSFEDMRLMSLCKHHIIANSSFSWWGAWLNPSTDKIVIAPKQWFNNNAWDAKDIVPKEWIKI